MLTWYPYDDTRYSDQPFWIIWAVCELIKETGDLTILDERLPWQDGGEATVLDHVKAAVDRLLQDMGAHGLTRIFFADWNDALNITTDPEAEYVMLSHQIYLNSTPRPGRCWAAWPRESGWRSLSAAWIRWSRTSASR